MQIQGDLVGADDEIRIADTEIDGKVNQAFLHIVHYICIRTTCGG